MKGEKIEETKNYWLKFFVIFFIYGFIKRYFGITLIENIWIEEVVSGLIMGGILRLVLYCERKMR